MSISHRLFTLVGLLAAQSAFAADLPPREPSAEPPIAPPAPVFLDGSGFYAHVGAAGAFLDAGAAIYSPLGRVPGATIKIAPVATLAVEGGYRFTPNWGVSLSGGYPPTAEIEGAGTARGLGRIGTNTAGPFAVTGHYHITSFGAFQPYVGGGPAYLVSFSSHDGAWSHLDVSSAWGAVAQVGTDYMLSEHVGLFVDAKWAYLHTTARGLLGPVPLNAKVTLDPFILSAGIAFRL